MAVDLLEDWRRYEKSLLQKLRNREDELLSLHTEYIEQQRLLNDYRAWVRAVVARRWQERCNAEIESLRDG